MATRGCRKISRSTIYLVRHGHSDWAADDRRPLSESGREAARAVARVLEPVPVAGIYSSPFQRSVETVAPLAARLGIRIELAEDLRERQIPVLPAGEFERFIESAWRSPEMPIDGAESNAAAQARGLAVLRAALWKHGGEHVVLATHGNLLALMLNGLDSSFGYEFWRELTFPDVYRLDFDGDALASVARIWQDRAR